MIFLIFLFLFTTKISGRPITISKTASEAATESMLMSTAVAVTVDPGSARRNGRYAPTINPLTTIGGMMPKYLFFFPISLLKMPAIKVASVPPMISIGPKAPGLKRFARKHPIVTPGTVPMLNAGRIVNTSASRNWIGP